MAGYTRQSSFADGDTITAALFNDEYNQLVNAFSNTTGHSHDGTAASGPVIGLIGDAGETSPNNKVLIDTTNNYIEFYVEVSSSPVQQLYIADGAIVPVTDSDVDLGTSSLYFKDAYIDSITTTGNVSVGGNLTVTGTTTFNGGTLTLGDAADDNVVFGADVNSNIIPNTDNTYDLGSSSQEWKDLYVDGIAYLDGINFNGTAITSTAAELNILDGVTSTAAELNILDGVTSSTAELNILDGVTSTTAELNILDGVTATAAEINILDGVTSTAAELNILDGVTSTTAELNILDGVTSTATELNILDGVTSTTAELNILDGVTSTTAELNILDGVTSTATELNIVDGSTSATSTTLADADRVVVNDNGTMVQVALTDFETYFESALDTLSNVTTVGALNSGSITSGFGSIDNGSSAITTTGTITYGSLSDGTITITAFVDEDDMASNSATLVPTQQSVKAYVDSQVTAQDLDLTTDSGTIAIDLDSETLTIGGTSNEIETSATGNAVTIGIPAAAQITTSLGVGGGSTNGVQISQGAIAIKNGGTQSNIDFYCESSNAHYARLQAPAHSAFSGNVTLTLPAATGTLVGSGDSGTVTNTMLAGSIANDKLAGSIANNKLANSTIGIGGIDFSLGDSDATPALDLTDATNYPTSSLTGTITNAQLAGSIANSKLANSSITVADSGGSNATAIALGGTITFAGTSNEVDVAESSGTVTIGLPNDVTVSNNLTVSGNLTVTGTTTQTGPIVSDDNFTGLTNANTGNSTDFGLYGKYVESSTTKYAGLFYDASTDNTFRLFTDTQTEPASTVNTSATGYAAANLVVGNLTGTIATAAQTNITSVGTLSSLTVSGDVTIDTSTLKVDSSNNRVGIGNASPDVSLDIGSFTDAIHVPVGTTAQRPSSPAAGYFRYNSTTGGFEGYTTEWGAIAGSGGSGVSGSSVDQNTYTGDGSTTAFTLAEAPTGEDNTIVFIDGVYQDDSTYSVSGTTLTFSTAPANSRVITAYTITSGIIGTTPSVDTMTGDGSDTTLTLSISPASENATFVTIDGVVQHKDTYSVSGTTLTFSAAPPNGSAVECISFANTTTTDIKIIQDADEDTKIQVEESSDEDIIRFDTAGTERMTIGASGDVSITGNLDAGKLTSNNGVLELDDNGSHNGIINVPASLSINIDSDNGATNETFTVSKDKTGINDTDVLFRVQEDGFVLYKGPLRVYDANGDGTESAPSLCVGYDNDTGFFRPAANNISMTTGGTEKLRIDSNAIHTGGMNRASGWYGAYSAFSTGHAMEIGRSGSYGYSLSYDRTAGQYKANVVSGYDIRFQCQGNQRIVISDTGHLYPYLDNTYDLGLSNQRFDDIYATNSTIQTSDRNQKNTITDTDLGLDFINRLSPKSYKFNDGTRTHYGLIAQDVEDVLEDINKPTSKFAGFIKNDKFVRVGEDETNEDGTIIEEAPVEQVEGEYTYGLRYTEFISPMIKAIQELKADNDALRARIETLENA